MKRPKKGEKPAQTPDSIFKTSPHDKDMTLRTYRPDPKPNTGKPPLPTGGTGIPFPNKTDTREKD